MALFIQSSSRLWPDGQVPYEIDDDDFPAESENRAEVQKAIDHWNNNTNITLVMRNGETHYVRFEESADICNSDHVGKGSGLHVIACDVDGDWHFGNVIHEIGHAIGIYHEHQLWDRDSNVTYNSDKVKDGPSENPDRWRNNFNIRKNAIAVGDYDFGSIMHYGKCVFSVGGPSCSDDDRTLVTTESIGQRTALSDLDIAAVRQIYAAWKPASNGDVPDGALEGGHVMDGGERKPLYIVRAFHQDGVHPGKLWKQWAHIPWGGEEKLISSYDVLCDPDSDFEWVADSNGNAPDNAFMGGYVNSGETDNASWPLIIVRAEHRNGIHPSKLWKQWAHIPWGGEEVLLSDYEVLCLK